MGRGWRGSGLRGLPSSASWVHGAHAHAPALARLGAGETRLLPQGQGHRDLCAPGLHSITKQGAGSFGSVAGSETRPVPETPPVSLRWPHVLLQSQPCHPPIQGGFRQVPKPGDWGKCAFLIPKL